MVVDPDWVAAHFTGADGSFRFARWGRALVPVIVGTDDAGCRLFEAAIEATARAAGQQVHEMDAELGANLLVYMVRDWQELVEAPNLVRLIPDTGGLIARLSGQGANQYRVFAFDDAGAIRMAIVLLCYDETLQQVSAPTLALGQAVQAMLTWSDLAFRETSPLVLDETGDPMLRPEIADLLAAAYDPVLPPAARDVSFALRLAARMGGG